VSGGFVSLVGAGPGDPGLLTLAGRDRLARADVVVYDRLVAEELLEYAPEGAELVYAGKSAAGRALSQEEINGLLITGAREGKRVVRLKGGDPFVFGRGGEEALALAAAGIAFEVVPGVTSAVAAPAYAGVPVTHRGLASSFAVVTGHEEESKEEPAVDWARLATAVDTIVILMGASPLAEIAARLIAGGRDPRTPAISVEWGTSPRQRSVAAPLTEIAAAVRDAGLGPPLLTVVGEVASLGERIGWFESLSRGPLAGKRVLVTRTRTQASALSDLLRRRGAVPVELAALEVRPSSDEKAVSAVIAALAAGDYDWCLFTSANAVEFLRRAVAAAGRDARIFAGCRLAAIGSATATALEKVGLRPDLTAADFTSEGLLAALAERQVEGARVLLPSAADSRPVLAEGLRSLGAAVHDLVLYETNVPGAVDPRVQAMVRAGEIDVATFASSSAVRHLAALLGEDFARLKDAVVACIGPVTAATARQLGLTVHVQPAEHTLPALVEALEGYFGEKAS
jgi:uroporphyrinogen III methyltransferase/synthase